MPDYRNDEIETTFTQTADDHSKWRVYTADPFWVRRLDAIGATLLRDYDDYQGRLYEVRADQMALRKGKRQLSAETKAALAERLQDMRAATAARGA